jgi:hypothetical protein
MRRSRATLHFRRQSLSFAFAALLIMTQFYTLDGRDSPWGDYSDILISGMSAHEERKDGLIQLERTGPYVPPISFPGIEDIVVTAAFKKLLESSGLAGMRFQPVIKKHIVRLDWHLWDKSKDEPPEYPEEGEPEGYILDRPHCLELSEQMGDLWEVVLAEAAKVHQERRPTRTFLVAASLGDRDLFRAEDVGFNYATEKARAWLEQHAAEHVSFKEVQTV